MTNTQATERICRHCTTAVHYSPTTGGFVHTASGNQRCPEGTPGLVPLASPQPRCPDCGGPNITDTQEAWGDRTKCADCPHEQFNTIGD